MSFKAKFTVPELPTNFFRIFEKTAQINANKYMKKLAEELLKDLKAIVEQQKFRWKPLSPAYAKYKEREGLDHRILIATHEYLDSITVEEIGGKIYFGPKDGIHEPSGLTYQFLAKIHEYGTKDGRVPARPLWRPFLSIALRKHKKFRKMYEAAVAKELKKAAKKKSKPKRG